MHKEFKINNYDVREYLRGGKNDEDGKANESVNSFYVQDMENLFK
jgi:hypothetical protein